MKQISPIQIWVNGQNKTAQVLDARIINDDLATSCTFYWELKEASTPATEDTPEQAGATLAQGNVSMTGEDYENWDDSNDSAYQFIAERINVVILAL
jgi:hypothetical protein